jgi:hypothetical protein
MGRRIMGLALLALLLAVGAQAQTVGGTPYLWSSGPNLRGTGTNSFLAPASEGAQLAPAAISAANYTGGAPWDLATTPGTAIKNAAGTGTLAPTAAIVTVANTTYKAVLSGTATAGSLSCTMGGLTLCWGATEGYQTCSTTITATGTAYSFITAASNANLVCTPTDAYRGTVTSISVKARENGTGDLYLGGNLTVRSPAYFNGPVYASDGTAAAPGFAWAGEPGTGFFRTTALVNLSIGGALRYVFGAGDFRMYSDSASVLLGANSDTKLLRIAANHLGMRNAANAQTFSIAATDGGGADYERLAIEATTGGAFKLTPKAGGTGALRPVGIGDGGVKPACDATNRGGFWYDAGGAGVADTFEVCTKDVADAYAWRAVY